MAVPKRKVSRTRRDKRRTHWKAKNPAISAVSYTHLTLPTIA
jgi:ribosomal protein L32